MINFYKPKNVFIDSFLLRQAIGGGAPKIQQSDGLAVD